MSMNTKRRSALQVMQQSSASYNRTIRALPPPFLRQVSQINLFTNEMCLFSSSDLYYFDESPNTISDTFTFF